MEYEDAEAVLRIVMAATEASRLPIEHLDIFNEFGFAPRNLWCRVLMDAFLDFIQGSSCPVNTFQSVKTLSLVLAPSFVSLLGHNTNRLEYASTLRGIMGLWETLPKLERLEFSWYNGFETELHRRSEACAPCVILEKEKSGSSTSSLRPKRCCMVDLVLREDDLLQLVKDVLPEELLVLRDITLTTGTYDSLFSYLALPDTAIRYCRFLHLHGGRFGRPMLFFASDSSEQVKVGMEDPPMAVCTKGFTWKTSHGKESILYKEGMSDTEYQTYEVARVYRSENHDFDDFDDVPFRFAIHGYTKSPLVSGAPVLCLL